MKQGLLLLRWSSPLPCPILTAFSPRTRRSSSVSVTAVAALETSSSSSAQLTGRQRRQLRNESRTGGGNWREEVEDRLLHKPKKRKASWTEDLNLDNLALLGPQWWVVRVSRVNGNETADRLARSLVRKFPNIEFKVYCPAVREARKLKNGSHTIKLKPLFPGCIFLMCILNKEIHDFIRECDGVGGILGSKVGNSKRQINRPKPVPIDEIEAIFQQVKEEQENYDQTLEEEPHKENTDLKVLSPDDEKSTAGAKLKRQSKKGLKPSKRNLLTGENYKSLAPGTSVRVLSGPFTDITGQLKELNPKKGKATVGLMLFGKESLVDLEVDQIAVDLEVDQIAVEAT